jgi:hypothetical protein
LISILNLLIDLLFFTYYFSNYNAEELTQKSGTGGYDALPSKYFEPLQWACESKIPRLMDIAIDALHYMMGTYNSFIHSFIHSFLLTNLLMHISKLDVNSFCLSFLEYGLFGGEWLNPIVESAIQEKDKVKLKTKFDFVIVLICNCADEMDDTVQLQVIKALLTAVTSVQCEVHEASLLLAIRTCFNIHLMSKNSVNKGTAKAALTQMLSAINQRMEKVDIKLRDDEREKSVESSRYTYLYFIKENSQF